MKLLIALALMCLMAFAMANDWADDTIKFSVKLNEKHNNLYIVNRIDEDAIAFGKCSNTTLFTEGWNRFHVKANGAFDANTQFRAIGYADSFCFHREVKTHMNNVVWWFEQHYVPGGVFPKELYTWLENNYDWIVKMVDNNKHDAYWRNIGYVLAQFEGFVQGYQAHAPPSAKMTRAQLWFYQSLGDLLDLVAAIHPEARMNLKTMTPDEVMEAHFARDHCSGLTRLTDNNKELFFSQVAWFALSTMGRVYKQIEWNTQDTKAQKISFSSYPGFVFSFDDFMISDQGLAHLETTNEVFKTELYDLLHPETALTWMRNRAAIQMADNGKDWTDIFAKHNSGSYNNQWQVVDYKKFSPGQPLKEGAFWVLEQIPGYTKAEDLTSLLESQRYFPSYNIPYFKEVFDRSGYPGAMKKSGDFWSYDKCPRANIFRRDAVKVNTMEEMKKMMRYNDYKNDPLTLGDPGNTIASRYDLKPKGMQRRECFGAMDGKITSYADIKKMEAHTISSPTYDQQPVFSWKTTQPDYKPIPHEGLPDTWNFPWMKYNFLNEDF
eukprot:TRINITY_DN1637_c0_g3_i1.p1 TRINITY_DN1637_c0_g3~~TRINITY_DN1637_c0_g3_i1.p1  ORF type:complete len:549 (-),score=179.19 TRINITY_DN1637_c0_g3_i1:591-2237(-)